MDTVVFLDRATVPVTLPKLSFAHKWKDHESTDASQLVDRLQGATVAITNKVPIRQADLEQLKDLKLIVVAATGFDIIDVAWCRAHGIAVANVPAYSQSSVADHVLMLILALRRSLLPLSAAVRDGRWQRASHFALFDYPLQDLKGSLLGLVGYGAIAAEVERRAKAFGMQVVLAERKGAVATREGRVPFQEVLGMADVLSLHTPMTPETKRMIGAQELRLMKKSALLINTARGGLVDPAALAEALKAGRLGGAGVDVLEEEPPRGGNPLLDTKVPNLIVTPHVAWSSQQALSVLADRLIENIEAFKKGKSLNRVA